MLKVNHADYMRRESTKLEIFRPYGSGDYIFIYFPVRMMHYVGSKPYVAEKNACVIYAPSDKSCFTGYEEFVNSYVHFTDTEGEMKNYHFPTGKLFYPSDYASFNEIIEKIKNERFSMREMSEQLISTYMTELLIMTERAFSKNENDDIRKCMEEVRFDILSNCSKEINIKSALSKACMSRTQFYKYYKDYFGITPKGDLLRARMERASVLLSDKNRTVSEISNEVGFNSVEHFTRYYRQYFGKAPRR